MNKRHWYTLAWLGSVVLAGCEGGSAVGVSTGDVRVDAPLQAGISATRGGIAARVGGATYHFSGDARYTAAKDGRRSLNVLNLNRDESSWSINALPAMPGTYQCDDGGLSIRLQRDTLPALSTQGGDCEVTVTSANIDILRGTFHARLVDDNGIVQQAQDGHFEMELASAIPDLDSDGWSDADDNCPFTANPDQADADADERGDACEAAENGSS